MSDTVEDLVAKLSLKIDSAAFATADRLLGKLRTAVAGLAIYEGFKFLGNMFEQTEEAAVGTSHLSEKLGISTDAVQELQFAAEHTGASAAALQTGMQRLARGFEEAKTKGTGPFVEALQKLKIPMSQIKDMSLDDVLMRVSDGFADAGPKVNKTAISMDLMGRGGTALIPMLNLGADGMAELRRRAHELGAVIDGETIKSFKEFEEKQKDLSAGLKGLRNTVMAALLPAMTELAEGALKWFTENRVEITHKLAAAFEFLGNVLRLVGRAIAFLEPVFSVLVGIFTAAWRVLEQVYDAVAKLVDENETLREALEAVAVIAGIVALALLAPWVLVVAGVAAVIAILGDLINWFTGSPSYIEIWVDYLDDIFENQMPNAVRVWWDEMKLFFAYLQLEFDILLKVLDVVKTYIEGIIDNFDKISSVVGGLYGKAGLDWATGGGTIDTGAAARHAATGSPLHEEEPPPSPFMSFFGGEGDNTDAEATTMAAQRMFGIPGAPMAPVTKVTTIAPQIHMTVSGVVGDGDHVGRLVVQHVDEWWKGNLRLVDATTEKP